MLRATIKLPRPYPSQRAVLDDTSPISCCIAAPSARMGQAMLGWLLSKATTTPGMYVYASSNPGAAKERLKAWLTGVPHKIGNHRILIGNSGIQFARNDALERIPVDSIQCAVITGCETAPDPLTWVAQFVRGPVRLIGLLPPRGTWWEKATTSLPVYRVTGADAVEGGQSQPDELERARTAMGEVAFARQYALLEESISTQAVLPFNEFARTRLKIRDKGGNVIPFELNGQQVAYDVIKAKHVERLRAAGLPVKFLVLKYRRGGITTYEQGRNYELCSTRSNVQAVTLAHTRNATQQIFRIAQLYHREDPNAPRIKGTGNASRLEFADINSQFFIGTARSSGFGRGDTFQLVHGSEVSKWANGPKAIDTVRDLVAGLTEAASHGEVTLETTANGNEWFAQTYRAAKNHENDWTPIFLPWFSDLTNAMRTGTFEPDAFIELSDREQFLVEQHGLTVNQLAWRRNKVKDLGILFPQEYPEDDESCFLTTGLVYFSVSRLVDLLDTLPEYDIKEIGSYGQQIEWEQPIPGEEYVAGCDTSEGVVNDRGEGGDPNGVGVLHKKSGRMVAAIHGYFEPSDLAVRAAALCARYNGALLGVERNNHGHAVLLKLQEIGYSRPQSQLYYREEDERPGWLTNSVTRPVMLAELREAVEDEDIDWIRDRQFIGECLAFKKQKNNNFAASSPDHDDRIIKWAIAWQMRKVWGGGGIEVI